MLSVASIHHHGVNQPARCVVCPAVLREREEKALTAATAIL